MLHGLSKDAGCLAPRNRLLWTLDRFHFLGAATPVDIAKRFKFIHAKLVEWPDAMVAEQIVITAEDAAIGRLAPPGNTAGRAGQLPGVPRHSVSDTRDALKCALRDAAAHHNLQLMD